MFLDVRDGRLLFENSLMLCKKKKKTTRKYKTHTYTCGRELEDQFILKLKGMGRRGEC